MSLHDREHSVADRFTEPDITEGCSPFTLYALNTVNPDYDRNKDVKYEWNWTLPNLPDLPDPQYPNAPIGEYVSNVFRVYDALYEFDVRLSGTSTVNRNLVNGKAPQTASLDVFCSTPVLRKTIRVNPGPIARFTTTAWGYRRSRRLRSLAGQFQNYRHVRRQCPLFLGRASR